MAAGSLLPRPVRSRRYRFLLTPLADVMFLLLVFFMLSSSLTPYSLLTLRGGEPSGQQPGQSNNAQSVGFAGDVALWSVSAGEIATGGQSFGFDALPNLTAALTATETSRVVIIARQSATVQDIASVLEALSGTGIADVQLARAPR